MHDPDPYPDLDLDRIREAIDALDQRLLDDFLERMRLSDDVARAKRANGGSVHAPERERLVLERIGSLAGPEWSPSAQSLFQTLMRLSRERQYDQAADADPDWHLGRMLRSARTGLSPTVLHYAGREGSFSHQAALRAAAHLSRAGAIPVSESPSFAEACRRTAADGEGSHTAAAVLPAENSTAGTVGEVADLLMEHDLHIAAAFRLPVRHALLALPGAPLAGIRTVGSHPQALAQCAHSLRRLGVETEEFGNTAFAAAEVLRRGDSSFAAVASLEAAHSLGLQVLDDAVHDDSDNETRFILACRPLVLRPSARLLSLVLQTPHVSGALAAVLALFADRGLNLAHIESRPIPAVPWSYRFHVDVEAHPGNPEAMRVLYQLEKELPAVRLMGWYGPLEGPLEG